MIILNFSLFLGWYFFARWSFWGFFWIFFLCFYFWRYRISIFIIFRWNMWIYGLCLTLWISGPGRGIFWSCFDSILILAYILQYILKILNWLPCIITFWITFPFNLIQSFLTWSFMWTNSFHFVELLSIWTKDNRSIVGWCHIL